MPAPAPAPTAFLANAESRRELHYFTLYRLLEAALLCLTVFSPFGLLLEGAPPTPLPQLIAIAYLVAAVALFIRGRRGRIVVHAAIGISVDIIAAAMAIGVMPGLASGVAMMLLFNIGAAALLLPLAVGMAAATSAFAALLAQHLWHVLNEGSAGRSTAEILMFGVSYLAITSVTAIVGRQMRSSLALAAHRGSQAESLAEVNELIIRRMRTGVLLVDGDGEIRLANEAAILQVGNAGEGRRLLATAAPELAMRLQRWKRDGRLDANPLQLAKDLPEVLPRFARLLAEGDQVLVFLDDAELASRRAETLTLATLGRFSASLAHEIRNPLAAISYSTQLLEESRDIPESDRRLLQIIYQQTRRMNGIIENVLSLARRERAQPEHVDLVEFTRQFVDEFQRTQPLDDDTVTARVPADSMPCLVDHRQLQQAVTALVHNARIYGRMPGEPARIELHAHADPRGTPLLDVIDHGPGIPEAVAAQLFRPFFTTSGHGTGLGLYIARELCLANQASLDHVPIPGGGCCFRIRLASAHAITTG
ncbi:MAG: PAS domain-containing sensor histidine kinase [Proteobacteria bacterium]|nr:PAS domain-containing sensor histidine kinase [Pseudomonadota bacterium]